MAYSPYNDLTSIYNAKVAWGNAKTEEEKQAQNKIANEARQRLVDNDLGYLAQQVSAYGADADAVKKVLDSWPTKVDTTTGSYKTGVDDNPAYNQGMSSAQTKNNTYWNTITSDHANVNKKYDGLYDYANQDLTQTDEYKSTFANIMPSYNLAAMQGRDNEVATGGANNGGNIDSFAAANAMRQQAALTAKGQALAHQMGLEAVNSRVNNARGILSDLGVYNSSVYSAMSDNINNERTIANDIFNNAETAKDNKVSRDIAISETAGELTSGLLYQLPEYSQFFNADGTLKNPDIDFTTEIEKAKAAGNTRLEEALKVARGAKIWGDYAKWGQYDDGNYTLLPSHKTANYDLTSKQIVSAENIAKEGNATNLAITESQNQNNLDTITKTGEETRKNIEKQGEVDENLLKTQAENEPKYEPVYAKEHDKELKEKLGIDDFGWAAILDIQNFLNLDGRMGVATREEVMNRLVERSDANGTDKAQLEKVSKYLGIGVDWLEDVRNKTDNYQDGVTWVAQP